jgi:signal recognition particle receptor subunit beta
MNFSRKEILCKIVYYGPGLCGKTTNLQCIHSKAPEKMRGNLTSVATKQDRTLFFDLLPLEIGKIHDFTIKLQLYTVPGQVYYNASRKIVLKGVDGVVFVADSQRGKMDENIESLQNLEDNLIENGVDPATIPVVLQYNKRDLPKIYEIHELNASLNKNNLSYFESIAISGEGVFNTLKAITKLVIDDVKQKLETAVSESATAKPSAAPPTSGKPTGKPSVPLNKSPETAPKATMKPEKVGLLQKILSIFKPKNY